MADKETVVTLKTNRGDIALRFFPGTAPEHVKNFIWHAENTYPGCTFHRVIPGFMIQGGDPNTKPGAKGIPGTGGHSYKGPGTQLKAEFNERPHVRGTLSMARSQDPNSAGSQFFIMHEAAPFLDGQYSVFGEAITGLDVVDAIVSADTDGNDRPREDQRIESVTVEEWDGDQVQAALSALAKEGR
ncbi:MAG: peptidylprolyl isomerase [Candidatus Krumholzibacteriia bacterium]|nr:peptidylprolyl isomerase [Candidatus Latescibacterota bacterium]